MTVTTRYELVEIKRIIKETDPNAFVNIVETVGVMVPSAAVSYLPVNNLQVCGIIMVHRS